MDRRELASRIEHTLLSAEAGKEQIHKLIGEAMEHEFAAVCVAGAWVKAASVMLATTGVGTVGVAGFPLGNQKSTVKAIEATSMVKDGAREIDVVAFLPYLLDGEWERSKAELSEIVRAARAARREVVVKVIIESALLMQEGAERGEERIALACRAIRESGGDFVKTSSGFHPAGGASVEAVRLMKKHAAGLQIKAAGGIRDLATARAMLEAGADRLGCSASVKIIEETGS